jgi:predicted PurR-regulated permease PerM
VHDDASPTSDRPGAGSAPPGGPAAPAAAARQITLVCLILLTVVATVWALRWTAALLVPLVLSVLIALALDPMVRWLERLRLPRGVAAALVVVGLIAAIGGTAYGLSDAVAEAAAQLPEATQRIRAELRELREGEPGALDAVEEAADDLEAAAQEAAGRPPQAAASPSAPLADIGFRDWLVIGSMTMVGWTGQILLLVFFVFFLLASDDLFKRKLVRMAGPSLGPRRVTVSMLDGIHASLERFMIVTVGTNALVAAGTFVAFYTYGVASAGLWALVGGALNTIPYLGSTIAAALFFAAALLQFETLGDALVVASMFVAISSLEGMLIRPWLIGRSAHINNVAVFASLFFWGWLWGAWGLLLAYPILMVIKIVADHSEPLQPVAELLGD